MQHLQEGIVLHMIPFCGENYPELKKQWVDFVKLKHATWEPSKMVICSKHFKPDDFVRSLDVSTEDRGISITPWLAQDEYVITIDSCFHDHSS